jgi:predicted DNA-binding transcriptional regulator AlpA
MSAQLLTSEEVAARLGIPVKTLNIWRRDGRGPQGKKIGVRVLYLESEVEEWILQHFKEAS